MNTSRKLTEHLRESKQDKTHESLIQTMRRIKEATPHYFSNLKRR